MRKPMLRPDLRVRVTDGSEQAVFQPYVTTAGEILDANPDEADVRDALERIAAGERGCLPIGGGAGGLIFYERDPGEAVPLKLTAEGAMAVREFLIDCGADDAPIWDDFMRRCPHTINGDAVEIAGACSICGSTADDIS